MKLRLTNDAVKRIAAFQKDAGLWDDITRIVLPRMTMQEWWDELSAKLEAIGMSIYDFDSNELVMLHEDGYNTDDALQMATG